MVYSYENEKKQTTSMDESHGHHTESYTGLFYQAKKSTYYMIPFI